MGKQFGLFVLVTMLMLLIACGSSNEATQPEPGVQTALPPLSNAPDAAIQAQSPQPGTEADIETVEVVILESFPVQVQALIRGSLPNTCTVVDQVNQARDGSTFDVAISTLRQTDAMCAEQRQPFEQTVSLDVVGLPAGTYTVNVTSANSVSSSFALAVDNEPPQPPPTPQLTGASINGVVWQDTCTQQTDGSPATDCVAGAGGGYHGDGAFDANEQRIGGVEVRLRSGDCTVAGEQVDIATTDASGAYLFTGLQPGMYCVTVDPTSAQNAAVLRSGGDFTYPQVSLGETTVTLNPNDYKNADFGWDPQFGGLAPPAATSAPVAECQNAAAFVADVTISDNTVLAPGEQFVKTWRVENSGSCPWSPEYRLIFVEGDQMGGPANVPLPQTVAPGGEVDVSVTLTAPTEPGSYRGDWKLESPAGIEFGSRGDYALYVQIVVSN